MEREKNNTTEKSKKKKYPSDYFFPAREIITKRSAISLKRTGVSSNLYAAGKKHPYYFNLRRGGGWEDYTSLYLSLAGWGKFMEILYSH